MSTDISTPTKTLKPHEVMDLIRAGIVLVVTVGLTVLVPPKVWGAGAPEKASAVQVHSTNS
jgi:hypothetical protein